MSDLIWTNKKFRYFAHFANTFCPFKNIKLFGFVLLSRKHKKKYSCNYRLTVKASCPMHLRKYPLDTQACPLEIGSCKYDFHFSTLINYFWINIHCFLCKVGSRDRIHCKELESSHRVHKNCPKNCTLRSLVLSKRRKFYVAYGEHNISLIGSMDMN